MDTHELRGKRGRRGIVAVAILIWLAVGVFAAVQRGYFGDDDRRGYLGDRHCVLPTATAAVIVTGPLNYLGLPTKRSYDNADFWMDQSYCD